MLVFQSLSTFYIRIKEKCKNDFIKVNIVVQFIISKHLFNNGKSMKECYCR